MKSKEFKSLITKYPAPFVQVQGVHDFTKGWKLSIQGKTVDDVVYLFDKLSHLLNASGVFFKFASKKLIDAKHPQQSHKLLTIYMPNEVDPKSYAELVYLTIPDYKGGEGITPEGYTHYKNSIFYRNDRGENGEYIMPYETEQKDNCDVETV